MRSGEPGKVPEVPEWSLLRYQGFLPLGTEQMYHYFFCAVCNTSYPGNNDGIYCNGQKIVDCPYCTETNS